MPGKASESRLKHNNICEASGDDCDFLSSVVRYDNGLPGGSMQIGVAAASACALLAPEHSQHQHHVSD